MLACSLMSSTIYYTCVTTIINTLQYKFRSVKIGHVERSSGAVKSGKFLFMKKIFEGHALL